MKTNVEQLKKDVELIESLGGPYKVAESLDLDMSIGPQRVSNWRVRGIPSKVKLDRPDLFLPQFKVVRRK